MSRVARGARWVLLALSVGLTACAVAPMGPPSPSLENIGKARAAGLPPLALGTFVLAPGRSSGMDEAVSIRANRLHSPYGNSFAAYLKETIAADLRAAGLLQEGAASVLSGQLTDSRIETPPGTASAAIAARFVLARAGRVVYDKELRAEATWKAEFNGFEAVPMAVNQYGSLYRQLTGKLFDDPDFRAATR